MEAKRNQKLFRQMSEPVGDLDAASARIDAFLKAVEQLRIDHHIRNVVVALDTVYTHGDDDDVSASSMCFGSEFDCMLLMTVVTESMQSSIGSRVANLKRKPRPATDAT